MEIVFDITYLFSIWLMALLLYNLSCIYHCFLLENNYCKNHVLTWTICLIWYSSPRKLLQLEFTTCKPVPFCFTCILKNMWANGKTICLKCSFQSWIILIIHSMQEFQLNADPSSILSPSHWHQFPTWVQFVS